MLADDDARGTVVQFSFNTRVPSDYRRGPWFCRRGEGPECLKIHQGEMLSALLRSSPWCVANASQVGLRSLFATPGGNVREMGVPRVQIGCFGVTSAINSHQIRGRGVDYNRNHVGRAPGARALSYFRFRTVSSTPAISDPASREILGVPRSANRLFWGH